MGTIIVHEMDLDIKEKKVRVGKEIEIDPALILEVHLIRTWPFYQYLSEEERKKVAKKCIGAYGSNIVVFTKNGLDYYSVIESIKYIQHLKEKL